MKIMQRSTLQLKLTIMVGAILVTACLILTVNSLFSAHSYYGDYALLLESNMVYYDPALPEGELPAALNPESYYMDASQKFSLQSVMTMVLIVLLALAVTYWAAGRFLRPLKHLTSSVRGMNDTNLDRRVELAGAQGEVLELTEAYNRMLDRLEESFLIQKSFASNAAHELKTPLAVIKSSLQVLEMTPDPGTEDYREFMEDTAQSLDRIIKTVDGLLSLANLAAAPMDTAVEVQTLLEQAVTELSGKASECGVKLSVSGIAADHKLRRDVSGMAGDKDAQLGSSGRGKLYVRGNASLLYRAFFNLIENAIKYNRQGGTVDISADSGQTHVSVRVADSGTGMGEDVIHHIFEPFYRGDHSRSQSIPGSGLGLAVVKMIVEKHDGEILVESEEGHGSVFEIRLKTKNEEINS